MSTVDVDELERVLTAAANESLRLRVRVALAIRNAAPVLLAAVRLAEAECEVARPRRDEYRDAGQARGDYLWYTEFQRRMDARDAARDAYLAARDGTQ
jgi:hypothetical protein